MASAPKEFLELVREQPPQGFADLVTPAEPSKPPAEFLSLVSAQRDDTGTYGEQLKAGFHETKSTFGSALEFFGKQLGSKSLEEYGASMRQRSDAELSDLPQLPPIEEVLKKPTLSNVFDYVTKSVVRSAPVITGTTAAGLTAMATLPASAAAAATAGLSGLTGFLLGAGEQYAEQRRSGKDRPELVVGAGLGEGILEAIPLYRLVGRNVKALGFHPSQSVLKFAAKEAAKTGAHEAMTEGAQELVQIGAGSLAGNEYTMADVISRVLNATVQGGLSGTAFGGGLSAIAQSAAKGPRVENLRTGAVSVDDVPATPEASPNRPAPRPIPDEMALPRAEFKEGAAIVPLREEFEKRPSAHLASQAAAILAESDPTILYESLLENKTDKVMTLASIVDVLNLRGLSAKQQDNMIEKRLAERLELTPQEAKEKVSAFVPVLNALREGTGKAAGNVIVTYNGPERVVMERLAQSSIPDASVYVIPSKMPTSLVQYAEKKYLISVEKKEDFPKAVMGAVIEESLRNLPKVNQEALQQKFQESKIAHPRMQWTSWVMQNLDVEPLLSPVKAAFDAHMEKAKAVFSAQDTREEVKKWVAANAAFRSLNPKITKLVDRLRQEYEPKTRESEGEISTVDPALDAATLTVADEAVLERLLELTNKAPLTKEDLEKFETSHLEGISWIRNWLTLDQQKRLWGQIPAVQNYMRLIDEWSEFTNSWYKKSIERRNEIARVGSNQASRVHLALTEARLSSLSLERPLTEVELEGLFKKHGLNEAGRELAAKLLQDFQDLHKAWMQESIARAERIFDVRKLMKDPNNPPTGEEIKEMLQRKQEAIDELTKQFDSLTDRTYYPLERFGKYTVTVTANEPVLVRQGDLMTRTHKKGDTVEYHMVDSRHEQQRLAEYLQEIYGPRFSVGMDVLSDNVRSLIGLPQNLVEKIAEVVDLTAREKADLQQLVFRSAPGAHWLKHRLHVRGLQGFSLDIERTYGDYMFNGINNLARVRYMDGLKQELNSLADREELRTTMRKLGLDATGVGRVYEALSKHFSDSMSPRKTYAFLNHAAFIYYFWANLAQPIINLTQTGLVTFPYMANMKVTDLTGKVHEWSHIQVTAAFAKATARLRKYWKSPNVMPEEDQKIIERAMRSGVLEESFASELAAMGAADTLQRVASQSKFLNISGAALRALSWPMRATELFNRRLTAHAVLELTRGLDAETRYKTVIDVVRGTHFEYSSWNRPRYVRGGVPAVLYAMKSYMQGIIFHIAKNPGGRETALALLLLAGAKGFPFGEDAFDVADLLLAVGKQLGLINGRPSSDEKIREILHGAVPGYEDVILYGLGHYTLPMETLHQIFGAPKPVVKGVDVGRKFSTGHVIPGLPEISDFLQATIGQPSGRDPDKLVTRTGEDIGGAALAVVFNLYRALTSNDPDVTRRLVGALPAGLRQILRAYRAATDGAYVDSRGNKLDNIDLSDPEQLAEVAAYGLGFTPTRLAAKQELSFAQREAASYWLAQKDIVMSAMTLALANKDKDDLVAARRAIRRFNRDAPPGLRISGSDLHGIIRRLKDQRLRNLGLPPSRRQLPLYRQQALLRGFGQEEDWEEEVEESPSQ